MNSVAKAVVVVVYCLGWLRALPASAEEVADLSGTSTHGVSRLAIYIKRIQAGLIDPRAALKIERSRGAVMAVDCGNGPGQVQAVRVLDKLIPMARENGIAAATDTADTQQYAF